MIEAYEHPEPQKKTTFSLKETDEPIMEAEIIDESEPGPLPELYSDDVIEGKIVSENEWADLKAAAAKRNGEYADEDAKDARAAETVNPTGQTAQHTVGSFVAAKLITDIFQPRQTNIEHQTRQAGEDPAVKYNDTISAIHTALEIIPKHGYGGSTLQEALRQMPEDDTSIKQFDKIHKTLLKWGKEELEKGNDFTPADALAEYRKLYEHNEGRSYKDYNPDLTDRYHRIEALHRFNPEVLDIFMGKLPAEIKKTQAT